VAPPLRVEWRPEKANKEANPLGPEDVREAFAAFGGVRRVDMAAERGANGRWSATVELASSAAAALAVGCRQLIVREKALTSEPLGMAPGTAPAQLGTAPGSGKGDGDKRGGAHEQPQPKKQRVG
jgi:hypothetical protein